MILRRSYLIILASLMVLLVSLLVNAMVGSIPPTQAGQLLDGGDGPQVLIGRGGDNLDNPVVQPPDTVANQSLNNTDIIGGGLGNDALLGNWDSDIMVGGTKQGQTPSNDVIYGSLGDDIDIWAPGSGSNAYIGGPGNAVVDGLSPPQVAPTAVGLTEYQIEMPTSLSAGVHLFNVANNGGDEHNLTVEGQGIKIEFVTDLTPGQTQNMQLYLGPGTYAVYCPVGDHREQGMDVGLTVTP